MTNPQTTAIQADPLASDSAFDTAPWTQAVALPDSVDLRAAHPLDLDAIEGLNATVFGPGRFARTAYRLRENTVPMQACCHICEVKGRLIASVVFSPIMIGNTPALLLGPLAVEHGWKNKGLGLALMQSGLQAAHARLRHGTADRAQAALVILVGDLPYYARAGFVPVPQGQMAMPGPVDPARLLACELKRGALAEAQGVVRAGWAS
jgi:predicted N-acetyltransferase YhbS